MHQYMTTGLSNGGPPLTTVLNGPVNNGIGVTGGKGIVSDVNLLLLQRIHQELKVEIGGKSRVKQRCVGNNEANHRGGPRRVHGEQLEVRGDGRRSALPVHIHRLHSSHHCWCPDLSAIRCCVTFAVFSA